MIGVRQFWNRSELSDLNVRVEGNAAVTGLYHVKGRDAHGEAIDSRSRLTNIRAAGWSLGRYGQRREPSFNSCAGVAP